MTNISISMNKLRIIIRLYCQGMGPRTISPLAQTSRNTIKKYLSIWNGLNMSYDEFRTKSDQELSDLFCEKISKHTPSPRQIDIDQRLCAICKALGKTGMTTLKQWEKYIKEYPQGYSLTQFRLIIQQHKRITRPIMHLEHKAGDKLFIDYAGDKLYLYPPHDDPYQVEVFVAILGCSLLTYVEAVQSQRKEDFISACENALHYYGGVTAAIVPDNLKSAVTRPSRYEAVINEEFERFAEHYSITVYPARGYKPRDKAHVENAVKLTYRDIYTKLEGMRCPDLASLNLAIQAALELHNTKSLTGRRASRRDQFEDMEKEELKPLNPIRYQIKKSAMATVARDGHVRLSEDVHYYSVPHTFIGKKVKISYSTSNVEVYYKYKLIASHTRERVEYRYTTNPEHLVAHHRFVADWAPEKFIEQAADIHEDVEHYITEILKSNHYPDKAYKLCSGVLNFAHRVGGERLTRACSLAASYGKYNYLEIEEILAKGLDMMEQHHEEIQIPEHENIRGKEYYK